MEIGKDYSHFLIRPHMTDELNGIAEFIKEHLHDVHVSCNVNYEAGGPIARALVLEEYKEHEDKPFYPALIESMTSEFPEDFITIFTVYGPRSHETAMWKRIRDLCGPTDPSGAGENTIRGKFYRKGDPIRYNCVHSPDSLEAAVAFEQRWVPKEFWMSREKKNKK